MGIDALPEWELPERIKFLIETLSQRDARLFEKFVETDRVIRGRMGSADPVEKERLVAEYIEKWIVESGFYWLLDIMYPYPQAQEVALLDLSRIIGHVEYYHKTDGNDQKIPLLYLNFSEGIGRYAADSQDNFVGSDLAAIRENALPRFLRQRVLPDLARFGSIAGSMSEKLDGCGCDASVPDYRITSGWAYSIVNSRSSIESRLENFTVDAKLARDKITLIASQNGSGLSYCLYDHLRNVFTRMQKEYNTLFTISTH